MSLQIQGNDCIPDLNFCQASLLVLVDVDVDGKMSIDVSHLVEETTGDTDDQIVDDGADGTEGSNSLPDTVVQLDGDDVLLWATKCDGNVRKILCELSSGSLDSDNPRTNVNGHY